MRINKISKATKLLIGMLPLLAIGCSKGQSYSELLREEEKACNWYLSGQNVYLNLPDDPKDIITTQTLNANGKAYGDDAPYYRMDEEGYVYMQVVSADFSEMVEEGDLVYFRFTKKSIKDMYEGIKPPVLGNSDYLVNGTANFVYKNTYLPSTTTWGTGIQMPLDYMGYNSEVNLVLKSYYGFLDEQSYCIPYLMNIRYFKPEY